jgi:NitT/TauT family transport system permease protein
MATTDLEFEQTLAGLDALELGGATDKVTKKVLRVVVPKLAATALFISLWQLLVFSKWKPEFVVPSPFTVIKWMGEHPGQLLGASWVTLSRGLLGFGIAILLGGLIGIANASLPVVRSAVGSMVTGLQTMPSIAWYPLAIVFFGLGEHAIQFVVVVGAAPSIANGIITGVDQVPPLLKRAGRTMGAKGIRQLRSVVLPASLPVVFSGLKQGWAFAWRSLLAGEIIVVALSHQGLGTLLQQNKDFLDYVGLYGVMVTLFLVGVAVDSLAFGTFDRAIRRRYGLIDQR